MCAMYRATETKRRKEIMDAASKVILEKGLEKTTMEDIIAGTSLSKGGVYHYYGSVIDIFKDIMLQGIAYRDDVMRQHAAADVHQQNPQAFLARELVSKIVDDNPYMPLYVEFLIAQNRNPDLKDLMTVLQDQTLAAFKNWMRPLPAWVTDQDAFQVVADFMNGCILASNVLAARDQFIKNREILEKMMMCLFEAMASKVDD